MSNDEQTPPTEMPGTPAAEASASEAGPKADDPPKAEWKFKKNLGINDKMKNVINLTISATQSEILVLRRKLEKLTYGS